VGYRKTVPEMDLPKPANGTAGSGGGSGGSTERTVHTITDNTAAENSLVNTVLILLLVLFIMLVFMAASFLYTGARRARHQMGMPAMTWVECLFCCCGTWSEKYSAAAKDTRNPLA